MVCRMYFKFKGAKTGERGTVFWYTDFPEWIPHVHKEGKNAREDFFSALRPFLSEVYFVDAEYLSQHMPVDGVPCENAKRITWSDPNYGSFLEEEGGVMCLTSLFQ